eukprot:superscaffoldBa00002245_g13641
MPRKYNKLSIPEALETAKQRLTALTTCLKRYTGEAEARGINRMFSTEPSKVYSHWQGNNTRTDPPKAETEQYWKSIWEKEASHNINAQWLVDLRADHSNLPEQDLVTITMADIQERVSDALLQELQGAEVQDHEPLTASNDWATRNIMTAERWKEVRPQLLLNALASEAIPSELRCPAVGTGTDRGEATAATWPYFSAMHEAIGGRPSIDPPIVMDPADTLSSMDAVASGSGSTSSEAAQSQETVEDEEALESDSDSRLEDIEPSTSASRPPRKKRHFQVLQFLEEEAAKEEERFN